MGRLVERKRCMNQLRAGRGLTDVVKVVTGMRRAGKSTLLNMYADELVREGVRENDVVRINLETFEYRDVRDRAGLDRVLLDRIGAEGAKYVFLDEIQNVDGWEESVSSLVNTGRCDVYVTGSNSRLLSSDLVTHISGRFVEIGLLPLSFSEYMELHPGDRGLRFRQYLRFGSLPEVDPERGEEFCDAQLRGVFNTVLVEDVLGRLGSGDAGRLTSISRFLYSNIGNTTNTDTIARELNMGNDTVGRYVSKLTEAFLFYRSERYDIVGRKILKSNGKYYASDLGLRRAALLGDDADVSRPLENTVYLELIRRGYTVRIGCYRDSEVDFTAFRAGIVEYYQVCLTMMSDGSRERELRPLRAVRDNYTKTVLTADELGLGCENGIMIVNVIDWLLEGRFQPGSSAPSGLQDKGPEFEGAPPSSRPVTPTQADISRRTGAPSALCAELIYGPSFAVMMFRRRKAPEGPCLVCGRREGVVPIEGGAVCRYCVPVNATFDMPSAGEVAALHVKDPELLARIDGFEETAAFGDLRFDDARRLFFKGPWPSYCIPVLSYSEIAGYRIVVDGGALAFNSVTGQRALFKAATDEYVRKVSASMDTIVLELDSSRPNVRFAPYEIRGKRVHVADTREGCLRFAIDVSRKLDSIIESNISGGSGAAP